MTAFKALGQMLPEIEEAEMRFTRKTSKTYDDAVIAAATAEYNAVLERSARAMLEDLGHPDDEDMLMANWKPTPLCDTWFSTEPADFLRHAVQTGLFHRAALPDSSMMH